MIYYCLALTDAVHQMHKLHSLEIDAFHLWKLKEIRSVYIIILGDSINQTWCK